jgi:hypothetical protein
MATKVKGELKIEFYAHLGEIKDLYFNQGIVVFKILHEKIVKEFNLTISYKMFCYYAKKELKGEGEVQVKNKVITKNIIDSDATKNEPIISRPSFSKAKVFNPHTSNIDEERIIK